MPKRRKRSQGTASALLSGTRRSKGRPHARRLTSACPVKCEAYFTGAAPCKRLKPGGLKRIGLCNPVNGNEVTSLSRAIQRQPGGVHGNIQRLRKYSRGAEANGRPSGGIPGLPVAERRRSARGSDLGGILRSGPEGCQKSDCAWGAKGDKVAIVSYSCYRWVLTDLAVACIGAVTVGIYQTLPAKDCRYIIRHSDAVLVFAEDHKQLDKLLEIRSEISDVRRVVLFSGENPQNDWVLSFEEFVNQGGDVPDVCFAYREKRLQELHGIVTVKLDKPVPDIVRAG